MLTFGTVQRKIQKNSIFICLIVWGEKTMERLLLWSGLSGRVSKYGVLSKGSNGLIQSVKKLGCAVYAIEKKQTDLPN